VYGSRITNFAFNKILQGCDQLLWAKFIRCGQIRTLVLVFLRQDVPGVQENLLLAKFIRCGQIRTLVLVFLRQYVPGVQENLLLAKFIRCGQIRTGPDLVFVRQSDVPGGLT
jgi:hypothetical protein